MRVKIVLTLLIAAMVMSLNAIPVQNIDLAALVKTSDLVFAGRVASISASGLEKEGTKPAGDGQVAALILIDRAIKGAPPSGSVLAIFGPADSANEWPEVNSGVYGMFFLKHVNDHYEFTDRFYPFLPAVEGRQVGEATPLNQVVFELEEVVVSQSTADSDKATALDAIARLHTEVASSALRHLLEQTSGELRLDIARMLVARNDIAGFSVVEDALLRPQGLPAQMVLKLAGSLRGIKDPRAVSGLATLSDVPDPVVRRYAASALRQTGSAAAIPALAKLLKDADFNTRYAAVAGLGEITHQFQWTPALDEFRDHEDRYLAYWQKWAESKSR